MLTKIEEAYKYIASKIAKEFIPETGIVLGSGLGDYANTLKNRVHIPYSEIPHFIKPTIEGHSGQLVFGEIGVKKVVIMQGRIHAYEGHSVAEVTFPIRVLKRLGIKNLLLTNAAGGVNANLRPGDLVIIKDHINLTGMNPLVGKNINELGPRFPDMTEGYSPKFRQLIKQTAQEIGFVMTEGVYCGVLGPSYETPAEINMMRTVGADLVGMSTIHECIVGNHAGLNVAGISCVTNMAAGLNREKLTHEEVKREADKINDKLANLINKTIQKL
jgi:purine-nucleoside phosphorylase